MRWIRPKNASKRSYKYICSACGEMAYCPPAGNGFKVTKDTKEPVCGYRFCPYCGLKAEESKE